MHSSRKKEEHQWLKRLAKGDEHAFRLMYDRYRPKIYTVALQLLKSSPVAEGIIQDVFLKVWKNREKLGEVKQLEGYLFMMARNKIYDRFKKLALEREMTHAFLHVNDVVNDTEDQLAETQYQEILQKILTRLTPQQREVYHLAREQYLSHAQIAEQLNISRLTVKTHMANALKTIRKGLEQHIELSLLIAWYLFD